MMEILLHLEQWLPMLLEQYGVWIYAILFLVILAETGSVFMFFLPGDSLLIAVGALCSTSSDVHLQYMGMLLFIAATLGYTINYYTGQVLGLKYFNQHSRFFKPQYIQKTNLFGFQTLPANSRNIHVSCVPTLPASLVFPAFFRTRYRFV